MKIIALAIALLTSVNSFAENIHLQVKCNIATPFSAECTVQNHIPKQVNCLVVGRGIAKYGQFVDLSGEGSVAPYGSTIIDITAGDNFDIDLIDVFDVQAKCDF